jgi:N-acetylmuramoyl-L-alanine amidase
VRQLPNSQDAPQTLSEIVAKESRLNLLRVALLSAIAIPVLALPAVAADSLQIVYPPSIHETTSDSIFVMGTAPANSEVTINGKPVERSSTGNFGPSLPLALGENVFVVRSGSQSVTLHIVRKAVEAAPPRGASFGVDSLLPLSDLARLPGETICLDAVAPPGAIVTARVGDRLVSLLARTPSVDLPDNKAALTAKNQPTTLAALHYQGCLELHAPGHYGKPLYSIALAGKHAEMSAPGAIDILDPSVYRVAQVVSDAGVARTGPSTDFSRLTPLPRGTQALVNGGEGKWLRLAYGGWIDQGETKVAAASAPPHSIIRSIGAKRKDPWTEISFPLQAPVPIAVSEGDGTFTLSLFGATAQTDIIHVDRDPLIDWMGWTQASADRIDYTFHLKRPHPWGYKVVYDGTTLRLSLRHPPVAPAAGHLALDGVRILIDPGHGGSDDPGTSGPNGTHEKDVTIVVARLVRERLQALGADVVMSREADASVGLKERQDLIESSEPTLSVSLHYNALPDNGDVLHTQGVGGFWYNPQAQPLAAFMQHYLVEQLGRPSYGLFWDNLALTRPSVAPAILLELGFLTNPVESEWATNPDQQQRLGIAIADGLAAYIHQGQQDSNAQP